ncbi:hypothetical protein QR680_004754 [Steinernema hermaphroditum]|uniref:Uncharacterized protein n=1 Tax=Steinernema hermaphroditum TaxID=289476 RepID=A0AA39HRX6_9BILA|nr:hypothetical protein QR680_004754 [Steinernema hermaphroditum]
MPVQNTFNLARQYVDVITNGYEVIYRVNTEQLGAKHIDWNTWDDSYLDKVRQLLIKDIYRPRKFHYYKPDISSLNFRELICEKDFVDYSLEHVVLGALNSHCLRRIEGLFCVLYDTDVMDRFEKFVLNKNWEIFKFCYKNRAFSSKNGVLWCADFIKKLFSEWKTRDAMTLKWSRLEVVIRDYGELERFFGIKFQRKEEKNLVKQHPSGASFALITCTPYEWFDGLYWVKIMFQSEKPTSKRSEMFPF